VHLSNSEEKVIDSRSRNDENQNPTSHKNDDSSA
jgi:hypothetical protein